MSRHVRHEELSKEIRSIKKEIDAVILAHLYQRPEVQDIADFVGDSLGLSQHAAESDAKIIIFCGVHFMAESASILCPEKTVVLPEEEAGCPMADMVDAVQLERIKQEMPEAVVVCYVNTSAEVKACSDIACTSSNAVKVVESLPPERPILFVPDKNLGSFVASKTGREITLWDGYCNIHDRLTAEDIRKAKAEHPRALVLVHPECRPEVVALAAHVTSTTGIINYAKQSSAKEFIIGTESGITHQLIKEVPEKMFYLASERMVCPNMKKTTLESVHRALLTLQPRVQVSEDVRVQAARCLERMLSIG
jgi:quinolinate synthase